MNFIDFFESQIKVQEQAIRSYRVWIAVLIIMGTGFILYSLIAPGRETASDLIKLGGGIFTAALATLPYKEITPRRERIVVFNLLKGTFEKDDADDQQALMEMAMDAVRESLKR